MYEQGFLNVDVTYDVMIDSFSTGRSPFAVTGPWAVGDFADVDYVVEPFPTVEGGTPAPFVGVQGFMVSAFAENELAAGPSCSTSWAPTRSSWRCTRRATVPRPR
jgi:arabinogalactan oligomer / maltooligosaccharide transport system substrate-binding protein